MGNIYPKTPQAFPFQGVLIFTLWSCGLNFTGLFQRLINDVVDIIFHGNIAAQGRRFPPQFYLAIEPA
jgi:hypothetical protein